MLIVLELVNPVEMLQDYRLTELGPTAPPLLCLVEFIDYDRFG